MTWVQLLAKSAKTGKVPGRNSLSRYLERTPYLNTDLDYQATEMKYEN
jgi:hypothetical protein